MAELKSQVDSLYSSIFLDVERLTGLDMVRDLTEVKSRVAHEGLSFLTRTLPSFYKHVLQSIECELFTPVTGFKSQRRGPLPLFMGGLVRQLFDSKTGKILDKPDPCALACIAQVCVALYKCDLPYTRKQESDRLQKFRQVEELLPVDRLPDYQGIAGLTLANAIFALQEIFKDFEVDTLPKHGPGAVSGGEKGEMKYDFGFSERIDDLFRYEEYFQPSGAFDEKTQWYTLFDPFGAQDVAPYSKGIFVPKDARGPRYISAEPKELMWIQQMLGSAIVKHFSLSRFASHINFNDQTINGRLALEASLSREYATLDMEDASDRVSLALVRSVLPAKLMRLLEACRSELALLPDGSVISLRKFAPMGSACCFPVESILFFVLSVAAIQATSGGSFVKASKGVYVFGDDIVVPTMYADVVMTTLEMFALKFNRAKCFVRGGFRESCGVDAFMGVEITPVKIRTPPPKNRRDVTAIISWTDTSNQFFYAGFWNTAAMLQSVVEQELCQRLYYVPRNSGCLGVTGLFQAYEVPPILPRKRKKFIRWNQQIQGLQLRVRGINTPSCSWEKDLAKSTLVYLSSETDTDGDCIPLSVFADKTLRTKVRAPSVQTLKYRWKNLS